MQKVLPDSKPRRALRPWSKTEDGAVIFALAPTVRALDNQTFECCRLNNTGTEIWRLCDGKHSVADIVRLIADRYGQDQTRIQAGIYAIIQHLGDQGYLEVDYESFF